MKVIDVQYKNMKVLVFCKGLEFSFKVVEGENRLGTDDKINIIKYIGGMR